MLCIAIDGGFPDPSKEHTMKSCPSLDFKNA